jgi:hypothetical protein
LSKFAGKRENQVYSELKENRKEGPKVAPWKPPSLSAKKVKVGWTDQISQRSKNVHKLNVAMKEYRFRKEMKEK